MNTFSCKVLHQHRHSKARVTRVATPHGEFITPVFMPVGTRAGVNNMTPQELHAAGSQIILGGNTYHMLCAPGMEVIEQAGGMHPFMGWHGPMLTDSGGFQVFSLSKQKEICTIDEEGAHFSLPNSQRLIHMTPTMSLETQKIIGADIIMAFDQCTPDACTHTEVQRIMARTHRWLRQSIAYHEQHPTSRYGAYQALFGIIQGGVYEDLRRESAQFVVSMHTDGIALGGETVGFDMAKTVEIIRWVHEFLPDNKPRYTMGVGMSPQDLLDVVAEGIDMFDCVAPTRNARHGALYCGEIIRSGNWLKFESEHENARIQIKKSCYADDLSPIMPSCTCYTCQNYSRAFLHHACKQKANLFTALASIHNIHVLHDVCAKMRALIATNAL
ncbi:MULTISPECIES: tRNA guanosine(34) transglycosylase Tgt [Legionella]|uniref:tRNA guanosine(34) transglycosylase Tgt n=1 Tax=Legionella septentrionalis TaxID=2498109 RepID=A0A433JLJ2_9GAMM|nr:MULTISPECIES: tRNA guanosine(34) transglycosylase Tgt [Legionella]MCP0913906.1 tRNA guanosine(34) transglycosylase Tgt [Legionella sp. 27cVA30]RUQ90451.1 tRNA guanosine(34) transglycosylase Tgt [Legionella septentrionalis]RUQ94685.1 tRNA guanosine(34) transglycosylase Tgt [Legionella septentrionalis]RUR10798.1 tRNA guanosine(34) transglycosylase Tgt [Legionella septentrionalis]RUR16557.1 tRNA guanosine(34) transglycosylase Tgt [Legionella septentrionalis]